ncbi:conserved hypothetical protein [Uncinocarpus reesii 1704]|uniref:RING-type domain-containing protein n=1 Tax=Uncinocarpus reesii (strain UAMH 1704) TaxID=336963 RepID=C4JRE6_UNCRE|nr:uncharacterized protein UREG_05035 [Uncinocarpus reesii 1704]EEP80193.1 conserved hypothetical protein [Uncinocarpus reesii 1704]
MQVEARPPADAPPCAARENLAPNRSSSPSLCDRPPAPFPSQLLKILKKKQLSSSPIPADVERPVKAPQEIAKTDILPGSGVILIRLISPSSSFYLNKNMNNTQMNASAASPASFAPESPPSGRSLATRLRRLSQIRTHHSHASNAPHSPTQSRSNRYSLTRAVGLALSPHSPVFDSAPDHLSHDLHPIVATQSAPEPRPSRTVRVGARSDLAINQTSGSSSSSEDRSDAASHSSRSTPANEPEIVSSDTMRFRASTDPPAARIPSLPLEEEELALDPEQSPLPASETHPDDSSPQDPAKTRPLPTIRLFPHHAQYSRPSLPFTPITRTLPEENSIIKVGRYSERDGVPVANPSKPSAAPVGFKSKVVSRKHCIDFRGGEEMIFRCVRIRIECNRTWQQGPNEFNKNTESLINNLGKGADADYKGCRECSICLNSVLRPYQCLFMAACAHVWHYKCIRRLIHTPEYPMFQCPNCRAYTDLSADVDDTNDLGDESQMEPVHCRDQPAASQPCEPVPLAVNQEPSAEISQTNGDGPPPADPPPEAIPTTQSHDPPPVSDEDANQEPDDFLLGNPRSESIDEIARSPNIDIPIRGLARTIDEATQSRLATSASGSPLVRDNFEDLWGSSPDETTASASASPQRMDHQTRDEVSAASTSPPARASRDPYLNTSIPSPPICSLVISPRELHDDDALGAAVEFRQLHDKCPASPATRDSSVYELSQIKASKIPSLSIVVGLILVFRNQTSYNRFWDGRIALTTINTAARNLTRNILINSCNRNRPLTAAEKQDIERTIRVLIAFPYAVKNYLRTEWSAGWSVQPFIGPTDDVNGINGGGSSKQEYIDLLPTGFECLEDDGLSIPLQLSFFVEGFIKRGVERGWYDPPGANSMGNHVSTLIDAYGKMETIKLTPIPIAHLYVVFPTPDPCSAFFSNVTGSIHQKQVLALFGCVLPFAMVDDMGWWAVPIVSLVIFTLYGIEGIGSQLEDPFGYDRNDIKMDAIVEDEKTEIEAILNEWKRVTEVSDEAVEVNGGSADVENGGAFRKREMFIFAR